MGGRFGQPSGICWGLDGDGPRFRPPEGSFANFFAKMANMVLRSRRENFVPRRIGRATRPPAPIVLSTRQGGLMRPMMVWAHDLRCTPNSLANKTPEASNRGGYRCVPPPVTTSPIIGPSSSSRGSTARMSAPTPLPPLPGSGAAALRLLSQLTAGCWFDSSPGPWVRRRVRSPFGA